MARTEKYFGTLTMIYGERLKKLEELGYKGTHYQFRIVCKAKSMAEANRKAESYGLGKKVFQPNYTCETGNALEIEMADKYGFIVAIDGTSGYEFVGIEQVVNK
jgi:hypothetical protein